MTMNRKPLIALVLLSASAITGCGGGAGGGGLGSNAITNKQGAQVHNGMTEARVRALLGKPESITKMSMKIMGEKQRNDTFSYSGEGDSTWVFTFTNLRLDSKTHL